MKRQPTVIVLLLLGVLLAGQASAGTKENSVAKSGGTNRTLGTPNATYMNINKISTYIRADGRADLDVTSNNSGFVYPKGSSKTAIFQSGFLWGARVQGDPQVRVGGSAYRSGLQTGKLLSPGVAEDPNLPKNRIYRVRPDWRNADLSSEIRDEGRSAAEIRAQYERDWNEWPATDGAPYHDVDSNGTYDASVDIPGVPGSDQTIWFVCNDNNSTNTQNLYGALPMGIEVQYTIWGYAQEGALGNMIFKSYTMINKGTSTLDSMFVCQWSDPDLGNAADDFVGCDTSLSIGFVYNAGNTDATYNPLPPPASGFDFFQGPMVPSPGSQAIFRGRIKEGYRNLPMTSFFYFINQDPTLTDPTQGAIAGSTQFYNFFRGRIGLTGQLFQDPQGNPTTFTLTGDPQSGRGWIDGQQFPAGDRRMGLASGPFTMAPGDTQEIVVAEIAAGAIPGVDRLSAVGLLKFFDRVAQLAYDNFFQLPAPPPTPKVTVSELSNEILLNWGTDPSAVAATENSNQRGFAFQGYNVYQLPSASASIDQAKKIATFDLAGDGITRITDQVFDPAVGVVSSKVVQLGTDSGIKRFLSIPSDALKGGTPLVNGIRYYFAVTSYSYSPDPNAVPNNLENPLQVITVVPHSNNPGVSFSSASGDTIRATHTGPSDGNVLPIVIDPSRATGQTYKIVFGNDANGDTFWKLYNVTRGDTVLRNQSNQTGDDDYIIVDGIQVKVVGPPPGMKSWDIPSGTRRFSWAGGFTGLGLEGFSSSDPEAYDQEHGTIGMAGHFAFGGIGTNLSTAQYHTVLLKLAAVDSAVLWNPRATPSDTNFSRAYRYLRAATAAPAKPEFAPWITNAAAGYPYQGYDYSAPFSAWDMDTNPPTRLAVGTFENNVDGGAVDGRYWPPDAGGATLGGDNTVAREFAFIFAAPYTETPNPSLAVNISNNSSIPLMWVMTCNRRADVSWSAGDAFQINANHVNSPADEFTFSAPSVNYNASQAKADISQVNVFPNPYYGVNTEELNKYQRFVTFSHLPDNAIIRIFNLAGVQIRVIRKDAGTSPGQFMRWDLANESGLPVGSGLYIAHIEMPDIGATKVLKLAIVQEQQILDRY